MRLDNIDINHHANANYRLPKEKVMKRIALFFLLVIVLLTGCSSQQAMQRRRDMYVAPIVTDEMKVITIKPMKLNIRLYLAENVGPDTSWQVMVWDKEGNYKYTTLAPIGINRDCERFLTPILQEDMEKLEGCYIAYVSHDGALVFNEDGDSRPISPLWKQINPKDEKYAGFMTRIIPGKNAINANLNSPGRTKAKEIFKRYEQTMIVTAAKYADAKHGTSLSKHDAEELLSNDSLRHELWESLTDDINIFVMATAGGINVPGSAVFTGVMWVVDLAKVFGENFNKLGYRQFMADTWHVSQIALDAAEYQVCRSKLTTEKEVVIPIAPPAKKNNEDRPVPRGPVKSPFNR